MFSTSFLKKAFNEYRVIFLGVFVIFKKNVSKPNKIGNIKEGKNV